MNTVICPFCGVVTDAPHETQEACIGALQTEIARTREILEKVTEPPTAAPFHGDENSQHTCVSPADTPQLRRG